MFKKIGEQSNNVTVCGARGYWPCKQEDNISIDLITKVCSTECTVPSFSGEWNIKSGYKSNRLGLSLETNVYIHFLYFIYGIQHNCCFVFFLISS